MSDRLFCHTCVGTDQQHAEWEACPDRDVVWLAFSDSPAGQHIRKWSHEPFDGARLYARDGSYSDRIELETRFWSIVDRDGLTGLPSDMWAALEMLVTRWRDPVAEKQREMAFQAGLESATNAIEAALDDTAYDCCGDTLGEILATIRNDQPSFSPETPYEQ